MQFLTVPKNILEKHLYHFSLLQRIFLVKALWICFFLGVIQLKVVFRDLCKYLQKMQLSSEKQTDWDGPVHLQKVHLHHYYSVRKKPRRAALGTCVRPRCDKPLGIPLFNAGSCTTQCKHFFSSILAFFGLLEQDVWYQSCEEGRCGQDCVFFLMEELLRAFAVCFFHISHLMIVKQWLSVECRRGNYRQMTSGRSSVGCRGELLVLRWHWGW